MSNPFPYQLAVQLLTAAMDPDQTDERALELLADLRETVLRDRWLQRAIRARAAISDE